MKTATISLSTSAYEMHLIENSEGKTIEVSSNSTLITGYTPEEFIAHPQLMQDIILGEDLHIWLAHIQKKYNTNRSVIEFRIHHKNGNTIWIEHTCEQVTNNGEYVGHTTINRDITRFKEESEELDVAKTVAFLWKNENEWPVEFVSENVSDVFGYTAEEFISGKVKYAGLIHPDDIEAVSNELISRINGNVTKFTHKPYRIITKQNKVIWLNDFTYIKRDGKGNITHYQGLVSNITEQMKLKLAFKKVDSLYKTVFHHSPLGIIHFDKKGIITDYNTKFASIFGVTENQLKDFNLINIIENIKLSNEVKRTLETGSGYFEGEIISNYTNKKTYIEIFLSGTYSLDEIIDGGVALVEDITKRKKTEKLQNTLYLISEASTSKQSVNQLFKTIHGLISELMPAKNLYIAIHDEKTGMLNFPYVIDVVEKQIPSRKFGNGLTEYVISNEKNFIFRENKFEKIKELGIQTIGSIPKMWVGIYLNFENNFNGVLAVQDYHNENAFSKEDIDVLEFVSNQIVATINKKYSDEKLIKSEKKLRKLNEDKDKFFSILAHDLKSPFQGIMGLTNLMKESFDELTNEEKEYSIDLLNGSVEQVFELIEGLLTWSRIQTGRTPFNPTNFIINKIVKSEIENISTSAIDKKIEIVFNNEIEHEVYADSEMIRNVLSNIFSNAIKFSYENSKVIIEIENLEKAIQISVEDFGVGISNSYLEKLFKLGSHFTTTGTKKEKGSGVGLIIAKELIDKNEGEIWVKSEMGKGSKFFITLLKEKKE